jgi:thiol-disulfide isomerase/thioredoxin
MRKIIFLLSVLISTIVLGQEELPSVNLTSIDGATVNSRDAVKKENIVVVSLWATWCVPCLKELDAINDVYEDWQDETNVELIAVSVDDSRTISRVKPLINGNGWDYEILLDENNDFKRALGAATVPLTLIIKDSKIVYRHSGYTPGSEDELYEKIKEYSN